MDAGLLDVLHHAPDDDALGVRDRVDVDLDRVLEEFVDQDGVRGGDLHGFAHVLAEILGVVDDAHRPAAEHVRRAHEHRVADRRGDRLSFLERARRGARGLA